jgi:transposase-like protein
MFRRIFGPGPEAEQAADTAQAAFDAATSTTAETETVRRVVGRLEALPPERARLVAAAAYTLARAAYADLDISDAETKIIEEALMTRGSVDESTAVLVAEMVKLQAKTVGGTEDYVVTRELKSLATPDQKANILRAAFQIAAASGSISAEESSEVNEIARELDIEADTLNAIRAEFHEQLESVQAVRRAAEGG